MISAGPVPNCAAKPGGDLEQIKFLLGHSSIQTTERYLGSEQEIAIAVNDSMGSECNFTGAVKISGAIMANDLQKPNDGSQGTESLLDSLRELIHAARQKVLRAVNAIQVQTCWEIGRHIVEFEQGGSARAEYGTRLLPILAESLCREFGKGFDSSNFRYMRLFYQAFPIRDALRHELSWTHYRTILKVEGEAARAWYMEEAASQGWTTRALERQVNTLYYERLLATSDRPAVEQEATASIAPLQTPRDFVHDPVLLEFLGLPGVGQSWRQIWTSTARQPAGFPSGAGARFRLCRQAVQA